MNTKKYTVALSLLNIIKSVLVVGEALVSKLLIEEATKHGNILLYSIIFASLIAVLILTYILYGIIKKKATLKIEVTLKEEIFKQILHKDINQLKEYHSGEITNIYLSDISNIQVGKVDVIPSMFLYASRFLLAMAAIIYIDYRILLILLGIGILAFISARIYSKFAKKYAKLSLESDGRLNSFMQEGYENIRIIKAMSDEEGIHKELNKKITENYKIKNKRNSVYLTGSVGMAAVMNISYVFAMIYGAYGIYNNTLSYGDLVALIQVVSYFESPISSLSSLLSRYASYKVSLKRIDEIFKIKDDTLQNDLTDFDEIVIDHISFKYDRDIYKDFSLTIKKGDKIILKGPSGIGKTTLFSLLMGFITPYEGSIYVLKDGKKYDIQECRKLFSYVSQENILFSGSIRENFALFVPEAKEEDIISSLKTACIYEELNNKDNKLDTLLKERGSGLSLGQIQRILLAICLLKDRPVLLLDEFTSALDKGLEERIVNNLLAYKKTMVIITHRPIEIADSKTIALGD